MNNKRFLKKKIAYTCGELAAATLYMRDFVEGVNVDAANELVGRIADLQDKSVRRCSFGFDKTARDFDSVRAFRAALHDYRHAAYGKLRADFDAEVAAIVKEMNTLVPADRRKELLH